MSMEDVIRWLRGDQDHLHECGQRLRERAVKSPPGAREKWIEDLQVRFDAFADCFRKRVAKEESAGYLKPVLETRPRLAESVAVLKREHGELTRIVDGVDRSVHRLTSRDNLLLRDCCKRIEDLLSWVERHEEHENHMVLYAFAEDSET